jgi:hypothetical protein
MRFRHRKKVDFPQPLGPMMAVMLRAGMTSETERSASFVPYQAEKSRASKAGAVPVAGVLGVMGLIMGGPPTLTANAGKGNEKPAS